ncbi:MAG TPA: hypothetical protein VFC16_03015, partial [Nakamurella sp.]|nr:hypothetical protein [Nakamurella sp.]
MAHPVRLPGPRRAVGTGFDRDPLDPAAPVGGAGGACARPDALDPYYFVAESSPYRPDHDAGLDRLAAAALTSYLE